MRCCRKVEKLVPIAHCEHRFTMCDWEIRWRSLGSGSASGTWWQFSETALFSCKNARLSRYISLWVCWMNCSSSVIHPSKALDLVSPQSFDEFVRHQVRSVPGPQGPRSHRPARSCGARKAQLGICRQLRPIGAAALEFSAQVDFRAAHLPLMCVVAQRWRSSKKLEVEGGPAYSYHYNYCHHNRHHNSRCSAVETHQRPLHCLCLWL